MAEKVKLEYKSRLGHIVLNDPPYNFLSLQLLEELNGIMDFLISREDCKAMVLSSVGKYFSAGFDYSKHTRVNTFSIFEAYKSFIEKMLNFEKPIIFAISGKVENSALDLLIFADVVLASSEAKFSYSDFSYGRYPLVGAFLLGEIIGRKEAYKLFLSGKEYDALQFKNLGIVSDVAEKGKLSEKIKEYLSKIFSCGSGLLSSFSSVNKVSLREKYEKWIENSVYTYLNILSEYPEYEEGSRKFMVDEGGEK